MRARAKRRGVTVVEVLMALAMLAIGASGVIAMQKVTVVANRDAKSLGTATEIARAWVERLRADAILWNHPSALDSTSDLNQTTWLENVKLPQNGAWFRPANTGALIFGMHDALGLDQPSANPVGGHGPYCVNLRLTWLRMNQSMRAEVRVYWLREGVSRSGTTQTVANPLCGADPNNPPPVQYDTDLYHFVHMTTELRRNDPMN
jgi:type IV pilus assembly protein PilV